MHDLLVYVVTGNRTLLRRISFNAVVGSVRMSRENLDFRTIRLEFDVVAYEIIHVLSDVATIENDS